MYSSQIWHMHAMNCPASDYAIYMYMNRSYKVQIADAKQSKNWMECHAFTLE